MPIHLAAPVHRPGGPDGQGWNRLSLNAHIGADAHQCALRPRSYAALVDSLDTRRAVWGPYGRCDRGPGACGGCPVLAAKPRPLDVFGDRVLVRLAERTAGGLAAQTVYAPHVMNRPDDGWASYSEPWTWEDLARLRGWRPVGQHRDEHSTGFWLARQ